MRNNKGVTLVELLVVIVVMGIIAGFAIPAVGGIISNANKDAVLNDAIQIENAARLYCSTTNDATGCEIVDDTALVAKGFSAAETGDSVTTTGSDILAGYVEGLSDAYEYAYAYLTVDGWLVVIVDADGLGFTSTVPPSESTREDVTGS